MRRTRFITPRRLVYLLLCGSGLGSFSCLSRPSAAELYFHFLHAPVPSQAVGFAGQGLEHPLADFMSWGYFTYQLDRHSLNTLRQHQQFAQVSQWNRGFTPVPLATIDSSDLAYYAELTRRPLIVEPSNKQAYEAVFFPYVHTIVYDTLSGEVQHFVTGMRD